MERLFAKWAPGYTFGSDVCLIDVDLTVFAFICINIPPKQPITYVVKRVTALQIMIVWSTDWIVTHYFDGHIGFPHSPAAPGPFGCHDLCRFIGLRAPYLDPPFWCLTPDSPAEYHFYHRMEWFEQTHLVILRFYFFTIIIWSINIFAHDLKESNRFEVYMNATEIFCISNFSRWRCDSKCGVVCK